MKVFVQMIDAEGRLVAQQDQLLSPAASAADGTERTESYGILVPRALPSGEYELIAGLYLPDSGAERVRTEDGADYVTLGPVTVAGPTISDVSDAGGPIADRMISGAYQTIQWVAFSPSPWLRGGALLAVALVGALMLALFVGVVGPLAGARCSAGDHCRGSDDRR